MKKSHVARQWRRPGALADQLHCHHTWAAIAVGAGTAIVGAYSAHQQANAANKPRAGSTDQTTTQTPYLDSTLFPDIGAVLAYQRGMANQGAPQIDAHGNVYYTPLPTADSGVNQTPYYGGSGGAGGAGSGAGGGGGARAGRGGKGPATWVNAKGQTMTIGAGGKAVPYTGQGTGNGQGAGGAAGDPGGSPSGPTPTDYNDPRSISAAVARAGLAAGNTSTQTGARNLMSNIWGAAGTPGGSSGTGSTEQTGYEGYNPILNRLAGTLQGNVDSSNGQAQDLLLNFLGEDRRNGAAGSGSGSGSGSGGNGFGPGYGGAVSYINPNTGQPVGGYGSGPNGGYGGVPDTMADPSFFSSQTAKMFDDPKNAADLQTVIDSMNADAQRGMYADLAQLDAASQGSGRLGGDTWKSVAGDTRRTADQTMLNNAANVRLTDRAQQTAAKLQALGLINQRDLGLLDANTSRANAATSAAAAGAGTAAQMAIAQRAQDLNAIQSLMQGEQFNIGQLGGVGQQLSSDRLGSLGMVPGLEGIGLSGLNQANSAAGNDVALAGQQAGIREAQIGAGAQRAALNQQAGIFNATQQQGAVNSYLQTILGIGGMGGTSHTAGVNVQPGLGISPTGSALQGALGGAATGYGLYSQYRNAGG